METLDTFEERREAVQDEETTGIGARLRRVGIVLFTIFAFLFFLVMKLPEARIQNLVLAHMRILAQQQGMLFTAEKVRVGMLLGPSLKIYNAELKSIDDEKQTLKIPYLKVRPHLLSLIGSTKKASISAELLDGEIDGSVGAGPNAIVANLDLDDINIGSTTLLKAFAPIEASGLVNGRVKLDLDLENAQKSNGQINLNLTKLTLPAQTVYGFKAPTIAISETKIEIAIVNGAITIGAFDVGKDIKTDDLVAKVTGDGTLDKTLDRSSIKAKAVFQFSQSVMQSFPLLESLLEPAKTPDGKYGYQLNGPLMALEARPGG